MKKATQLREELNGVLADGEVDRVVKSAIDAGTVENDIDYKPAVDPEALDVALEAVKKAMNIAKEEVSTEQALAQAEEIEEEVSKSLSFDEVALAEEEDYVDVTDVLDTITKGADSLLSEIRHEHTVLASAITEMTAVYRDIAKGINALSGRVGDLENETKEVQKGLAITPERKSVTGTLEAVPHPGDAPVQLDRAGLIQKGLTLLETSTEPMKQAELSKAISLLESGADINEVVSNYHLN
jgi:soluble cytochrome b562